MLRRALLLSSALALAVTSAVADPGSAGPDSRPHPGNISHNRLYSRYGAARVLLNTIAVSGSSTGFQDTTSLTAAFTDYLIVLENVTCSTTASTVEIQLHSNGAYQSSGYVSQVAQFSTSFYGSTAATSYIPLFYPNNAPTAGGGVSGNAEIFNAGAASGVYKNVRADTTGNYNGIAYTTSASGWWGGGSTAIDGFQIQCSSANISGTIKVYGIN